MTDIIVGNGVSSSSLTIHNGDTLQVQAGGSATFMNVLSGGTMSVSAGGSATSNTVAGDINVAGVTTATTVQYGTEFILNGGVASDTVLDTNADASLYGTEYVQPGGLAIGTQNDGAYVLVANGGVTSGTHEYYDGTAAGNTGLENVTAGGSAYDSIIDNEGVLDVSGDSFRTQVNNGGSETVETGGTASGSMIGSGGSQIIFSGGTITGSGTDAGMVILSAGAIFSGTETLAGSAGGPALFEFAATNTGTIEGVISGFTTGANGNQIEFGGYDSGATVSAGNGTVKVTENGTSLTVHVAGIAKGEHLQLDANGFLAICFLEGTHILADGGERKVETLRAGDLVATWQNGQLVPRPVRFVGYRSIKISGPNAQDAYPVRIRAGAFADAVPHRDLLITQDHCVFVEGRLIPARMLVNGSSIIIDRAISSFTFYHVELETHGILLAEGLTTESYLDTGNRGNFANSAAPALRPDLMLNEAHNNWAEHAAAPLAVSREAVEPIWQTLLARAEKLRFKLASPRPVTTEDPNLHLQTDAGQTIWPVRIRGNRYVFLLPPNSRSLRLKSRTCRPADAIGPFVDDRRALGVLVGAVTFWSGRKGKTVDLAATLSGWHSNETASKLWTAGSAELPVSTADQAALLEVEVLAGGPYLLEAEESVARRA